MQLGLVTYMWGADWDLPTLIKNLQATGFQGAELRTTHKHGVEPSLSMTQREEVAKRFMDAGLEIVSLGTTCEYHSPDPAVLKKQIALSQDFIKLAHDVGASGIKVRPNALPPTVSKEKTIEQIGKSLNEVASFADGFGIEIRVEVHGHGTGEIPVFKQIMDIASHKSVKCNWNCNPTDMKGPGLKTNFSYFKDRLGPIHIHDLISDYPWRELFQLLREAKFDGWTLVEEGSPTSDPIRVMKYYRLLWETLAHPVKG